MREWLVAWRAGLLPGRAPPQRAGAVDAAAGKPSPERSVPGPVPPNVLLGARLTLPGRLWPSRVACVEKGERHAGGKVRRPRGEQKVYTQGLVQVSPPHEGPPDAPLEGILAEVGQWAQQKLVGGLATSPKTSYGDAWWRWLWWCWRRQRPPLLDGERTRTRSCSTSASWAGSGRPTGR